MDSAEFGLVVAERNLTYLDPEDGPKQIAIQMGAPRHTGAPGEWLCPWAIRGVGENLIRSARGCDAFDALQNALRMIAANLDHQVNRGVCLYWLDESDTDLGFPKP